MSCREVGFVNYIPIHMRTCAKDTMKIKKMKQHRRSVLACTSLNLQPDLRIKYEIGLGLVGLHIQLYLMGVLDL